MADIIETVKKAALQAVNASKPMGVYFGTVTSVSPLRISVEQKLTLESPQLILARNVTDHDIEMTVDHWTENETAHIHAVIDTFSGGGTSEPTTHRHRYLGRKTFRVHNGLVVGDRVILLRVQGGQQYLVIDRVAL